MSNQEQNPPHQNNPLCPVKRQQKDQQATGGPKSLGVSGEERANPQLSSGMLAFNLNKPIFTTSFIVHSESASRCDASADSTTEAACYGSYLLLKKGASSTAKQGEKEEASNTIKLKDLAKLVPNVQPNFKDLDSPEDDPINMDDDSDEDKEDEAHTTTNVETKDTSIPKSSSPRSSQIQELTNKVLILQSQKHKQELEKNKAKAEAALLKAKSSFPNVKQLNELLVKSLQFEFSKILSAHDFSNSLPTEMKDLPSKFNELNEEIKGLKAQVHKLEIKPPKELKEIATKLEAFTKTITTQVESTQAKLKTLDALPSLLLNVTRALNKFAQVLESTSSKDVDQKEAEKESTNSDSDDDVETHVTSSMVESSRIKKLKKFDFVTEEGMHIHLSKEEINNQKKLDEEAKVEAAKRRGKLGK
ncbi:hypothetical protein Tco_0816004 [Tanacetum coccineum]